MALTNTSKPSTSLTNVSKPTTTFSNVSAPTIEPLWTSSVLVWQLDTPWLTFGTMTNLAKPS